jgi:hypothetical protein
LKTCAFQKRFPEQRNYVVLLLGKSKSEASFGAESEGAVILLLLAGVKPNSEAMRIIRSACRFATAT